jgi:hypothetical protein
VPFSLQLQSIKWCLGPFLGPNKMGETAVTQNQFVFALKKNYVTQHQFVFALKKNYCREQAYCGIKQAIT